ncbi:glycosyltransferase family 2 protein [Ectothiorhodospira variabilis]|uniref:glycosyltransferase family 2 protein n=1 Tax=Ectothiorhodospira variabilis TaxID=505694 RepID=UPI001EFB24EE|nr:glycosyltransferase family 2 protein [Ectothiorhodospira variabilis]MCG5504938.1 glycosyltransferase family 2 protein [Ectothiorhodospira variabilis]MCG5508095.1 glycosyltransferase family 2 protein [Ectothiorhodospira variabilis]
MIPAYNAEAYILDAIDSVIAQDYPAKEIIVVNDGSTDRTLTVLRKHHPSVKIIDKANGGAASARNVGIAEANGSYVAFLDADDIWLPHKLTTQVSHLEANPQVSLVCSGFQIQTDCETSVFPVNDAMVRPESTLKHMSGWIYHQLLLDCHVWTSTVVARRDLVARIGQFDEELRLGQDYDYWLRASRLTAIDMLQGPFARYRKHSESATARGSNISYGARVIETAIQRWGISSPDGVGLTPRQASDRVADLHFMDGYSRFHKGHDSQALRSFLACIKHKPMRFKAWTYLLVAGTKLGLKRFRILM